MPPRPGGGGPPLTEDAIQQMIFQMAQSSQQLTNAVTALATSQASFMRSAADADANIGLSKSQPYVDTELYAAMQIDNTVSDINRSGLPAAMRDTRPTAPADYNDNDMTDPRHGTFGLGHDDATPERADALNAFHRERGRNIRALEKTLPADGYMNTATTPAQQFSQWKAHPLSLVGSLTEGDVRKGEYTMSKYLDQNRWCKP